MPIPVFPILRACVAVFGFALASLLFASVAEAKTTPGELLVVNSGGRILADQTQYTATAKIKTDPKADCFGPDTGGSGDVATVLGATALGLIADGATVEPRLDPLSVTDSFDFGLGLCGIGKTVAPSTGFWYLKVDHEAAQVGGDQTQIKRGDDVLWYLIEDFNDPVPDELVMSVPSRVAAGADIPVKVVSYADDGAKAPAEGVEVSTGGIEATTGADGKATIDSGDADLLEIGASREGSIAAARAVVCTEAVSDCPPGYAATIGGTPRGDKITGGTEAETIVAGGGNDSIEVVKGNAPDRINCGAGKDTVKITRSAVRGSRLKGCERVLRPGK